LWRPKLLAELPKVELTLLLGGYAQAWALGGRAKRSMTETVRAWQEYLPTFLPMPHPSWRNTGWLKRHPWFEADVAPYLRQRIGLVVGG
jgi:uracil-DNA glycosylase